jgi:hypothetical protein
VLCEYRWRRIFTKAFLKMNPKFDGNGIKFPIYTSPSTREHFCNDEKGRREKHINMKRGI